MAKTLTYPMEKVLAVREVLRQLPAKAKEKSRAEVAEFLKADLRKAVKQGHSLKEIQAILAQHDISVSLSRMESVLGKSGKDSAEKKTGKPKPDCKGMAQGNDAAPSSQEEKAQAEAAKEVSGTPEIQKTIPARKGDKPSYYTPDRSDEEL
jgi:hypothetical protein